MIKFLIKVIFISVFFCGCERESEMYKRQYLIMNNTQASIKINMYNTNVSNQLVDELLLNIGQTFEGEIVETSNQPSNNIESTDPAINFRGDSLVVIFDNQRKMSMQVDFFGDFSEPRDRNLFRHGNYENVDNSKFLYAFLQSDFDNAEDCGGNCD